MGQTGDKVPPMVNEITERQALARVEELGFVALDPYPGRTKAPWRLRHLRCGRVRATTIQALRQTTRRRAAGHAGTGCPSCSATDRNLMRDPADRAQRILNELDERRLTNLEPYPGADKPWRARHRDCGREVVVWLCDLRAGQWTCPACSRQT